MTDYIVAVSDALGMEIRRFGSKSEAESYAEAIDGDYYEFEDESDNLLKEIENKIQKAVNDYESKKKKHIEGL